MLFVLLCMKWPAYILWEILIYSSSVVSNSYRSSPYWVIMNSVSFFFSGRTVCAYIWSCQNGLGPEAHHVKNLDWVFGGHLKVG